MTDSLLKIKKILLVLWFMPVSPFVWSSQ